MYASKTTLIALLASIATAAPLEKRIVPNTQSCTAQDNGLFASYSVNIGVTYAGGRGCNDVYNSLRAHSVNVTNWQCVDDGQGNTQLWFNTNIDQGGQINDGLLAMYPWIAGGFNCPDF